LVPDLGGALRFTELNGGASGPYGGEGGGFTAEAPAGRLPRLACSVPGGKTQELGRFFV
jgi:hypothetical protein